MVLEERRLLCDAWPEVKTPPISRAFYVVFSGLEDGASSSQATTIMLAHLASLFYNLLSAPLTFVTVLAGHEETGNGSGNCWKRKTSRPGRD